MITFLTRFRIGPRLAAAFAILVLGLIGMGLYGSFSISYLATDLGEIKNSRVPKVERLVEMADNINLIARQTRNILIFDNLERQQEWIASIHKAVDSNGQLFALVKPEIRSDEGRKLVAEAEATMKVFDQDLSEFLAHSQDGDVSVATSLMDQKLRQSQLKLTEQLDTIKNREIQRLGQQADQAIAASHRAQWIGLAVISALILLCTWMSWLITRSIVGPMQRALREANRIAEGDLSANLQVRGRDEAAEMLQAMMTMQAGLRDIVADVREGVASVASASQQIAMGNQDLSGRTEEQASSLQQTAASIEQISGAVKNNTQSAEHANELATSASEAAGRGGELVGRAVSRIGELEASSQRIAEIVGVIDTIAFQTNILALNAAVEAARAGEQGRGFAVVASEVRALAQRSADAAKEIKGLVTDSVQQIQLSSATARDAGGAMGEIVSQVQRVSTLVAEICAASREQDRGVTEVHRAMDTLDDMTQHNAALVEESAAAAESLKSQAVRLTQSVANFRLEVGEMVEA